jgi:hypothetical protein
MLVPKFTCAAFGPAYRSSLMTRLHQALRERSHALADTRKGLLETPGSLNLPMDFT